MIRNYIKIALRSLLRKKVFSLVNMMGLSVGIASCIMISAYLISETSFDNFHEDANRIYRVVETMEGGSLGKRKLASVEGAIGAFSKREVAAVEDMVRIFELGVLNMKNGEKEFGEPFFSFDSNFFQFFDYPLLSGTPESVFKNPMSVVLSESTAQKYFGMENPVGKTLEAQTNRGDYMVTVTGIMRDMPENSHLHFDMIFPHSVLGGFYEGFDFFGEYDTNWTSTAFTTYIKTTKGVDELQLTTAINQLSDKNRPEDPGRTYEYSLQPLKDIHFRSADLEGDLNYRKGDSGYMYIFSAVGLIIFVIAFANYINLSTVKATDRIKEIGLRKVVGARRGQLIVQFMSESLFFSIISFGVAFTLIQIARPFLSELFEVDVISFISTPGYLVTLITIVVSMGLLAGYYPALVVSKGKVTQALKSQTIVGNKQAFFKGIVLFQFVISLGMIIATIVVYNQLNYVLNKDLGYNQEGIALIEINSNQARENEETILDGFRRLSAVKSASAVSRVPAEWKLFYEIEITEKSGQEHHNIPYIGVDINFLDVFEIDLIAGRNFRPSVEDSLKVLINETLADQLGIKEVDGQVLTVTGIKRGADELGLGADLSFQVIGVIADFHFQSLREEIPPMLFTYKRNPIQNIDYFAVKLQSENLANSMLELKEVMKQSDPSPFDYNFLDDKLARYYEEDTKRSRLFISASSIAVFIAFIGLFALVHSALQKRVKELGVRKVLGAQTESLVLLLSKDYLTLLGVSLLIAGPLAYFGISNWLNGFAYKVEISWWFFGLALAICLVITALATMSQINKAISQNPSEILKQE